jgi:hypothetical protein
MQPSLLVVLVISAQLLFFSTLVFRVLQRCGRPANEAAALALCLLPVAQGAAIVIGIALGWQLTAIPVLSGLALALALLMGAREFLRQEVVWAWALVALCWLGQEALVRCHGRAFWAWDWEAHWEIATAVTGGMRAGLWPVLPGRTALLGVWGAPALSVTMGYPVFQITTVLANSIVVPAAWLWASRWGGRRGAVAAVGMVLLCAGLTQSAVYTWPKALAAALVLAAMYLWAIDWQVLAGLTFAAAFQAHQSAIAYTIPLFVAVLYLGIRRYPWRMGIMYTVVMVLWVLVLRHHFPAKWAATPYFTWHDVASVKQLRLVASYLGGSFFPFGVMDRLWGRYGFDLFLRATTDAWLLTIPLVGTVALASVVRRPHRTDVHSRCAVVSLMVGGLLAWLLLNDAMTMVVQTSEAPLLLAALAAAGAASVLLPARVAAPLWALSCLQFLAFRVPFVWADMLYPDPYNFALKQKLKVQYLSDLRPQVVGAVALPVAIIAAVALFLAVLWSARGNGAVLHATTAQAGPTSSGPGARCRRQPEAARARKGESTASRRRSRRVRSSR